MPRPSPRSSMDFDAPPLPPSAEQGLAAAVGALSVGGEQAEGDDPHDDSHADSQAGGGSADGTPVEEPIE